MGWWIIIGQHHVLPTVTRCFVAYLWNFLLAKKNLFFYLKISSANISLLLFWLLLIFLFFIFFGFWLRFSRWMHSFWLSWMTAHKLWRQGMTRYILIDGLHPYSRLHLLHMPWHTFQKTNFFDYYFYDGVFMYTAKVNWRLGT